MKTANWWELNYLAFYKDFNSSSLKKFFNFHWKYTLLINLNPSPLPFSFRHSIEFNPPLLLSLLSQDQSTIKSTIFSLRIFCALTELCDFLSHTRPNISLLSPSIPRRTMFTQPGLGKTYTVNQQIQQDSAVLFDPSHFPRRVIPAAQYPNYSGDILLLYLRPGQLGGMWSGITFIYPLKYHEKFIKE